MAKKKDTDVDSKIDDLEAAKEKYMSENTVISIGGYSFTPAKLRQQQALFHQYLVDFMEPLNSIKTIWT